MSHRDEAEVLTRALREASQAQKMALRRRDDGIQRARADQVSPKALAQWYGLSPEQIRRICKPRRTNSGSE